LSSSERADASDRASPSTPCPFASSSSATADPIHPDAPVTNTRMSFFFL
jgi:hypothetical protein